VAVGTAVGVGVGTGAACTVVISVVELLARLRSRVDEPTVNVVLTEPTVAGAVTVMVRIGAAVFAARCHASR
jgi:hypothetical protein